MIRSVLVVGTLVGMALAAASASAGPCTAEIESVQRQLSSTGAGMSSTGTGQVAEGSAVSPDDVVSQDQGEPSDSEAAQAGEFGTSAAPVEAEAALERARQFDKAGDEPACMNEIAKAKAQLGTQ